MKRLVDYCKPGVFLKSVRLHPAALMYLCDVILWCEERGIPCLISDAVSTPAEDAKLNRVSSTHRQARAFDVSTRGWTKDQKDACVAHFSDKYKATGAISPSTGKPRPVYLHDAGTGEHLHFQLSTRFALRD